MKCNVGGKDRVARIILGLVLLLAGLLFHSMLGLIGLIPLATGALRWCPLYIPLKIDTNR